MNLNILLQFFELKINSQIADDDKLLKKYDEAGIKNSVFDQVEFEQLKADLIKASEIDFYGIDISDTELIQLYNSKVDKDDREYDTVGFMKRYNTAVENALPIPKYPVENSDEDEDNKQDEEILNRIATQNQERRKTIEELLSKGFYLSEIEEVLNLPDEKLHFLNSLVPELPEGTQRGSWIKYSPLISLVGGNDEHFEKLKEISKLTEIDRHNANLISIICEKKGREYEKALDLLSLETERGVLHSIEDYVKVDDDKFGLLKELLQNPEYKRLDDLIPLLDVDYDKRERIKNYYNKLHSYISVKDLAKFDEQQLTGLENLTGVTYYHDRPVDPHILLEVVKNGAEEAFQKIRQLELSNKIAQEELLFLTLANDEELNNFILDNPDCEITFKPRKNTMVFKDASGVETRYSLYTKSLETIETKDTEHTREQVLKNTKQNKVQKIISKRIPNDTPAFRSWICEFQRIDTLDENGKPIKSEIYEPGDFPGVSNVYELDANNKKKVLQSSSINPKTGKLTIKKDFLSAENVRTQYEYVEDKDGNKKSKYVITDRDGKVLMKREQSFTVLSEDRFLSSLNGYKYEIEYHGFEVTVKDLQTNEDFTVSFEDKMDVYNRDTLINLIKNMSGEQLKIMKLHEIKEFGFSNIDPSLNIEKTDVNNGMWYTSSQYLKLLKTTFTPTQELFEAALFSTLNHEYGHFIDMPDNNNIDIISSKPEIRDIFKEELKAFLKNATTEEENFIEYFTGSLESDDRGAEETVAETNMLLHTNPEELWAMRGYYLQRYFPRTIAAVAQEITKVEQSVS